MIGVGIGLIGGLGLVLITSGLTRRRMTLLDRVSPYVRPSVQVSRLLLDTRSRSLGERIMAPLARDLGRAFETIGSTAASVTRRLRQAGSAHTLEEFRVEQVLWAALGAAAALVVAFAAMARGSSPILALLIVLLGACGGAVARDASLSNAATRRQSQIAEELPDAADLVALAVGAGEPPIKALERIAAISQGALSTEFRDLVARVHTGTSLPAALTEMAGTSGSPELARMADVLVVAIERGTPLADVLRDQARDTRENARQRLMEVGGTKEILMMIPVVFLILPVTVAFALFPGLATLEIGL
ncbi:MAG: type II secretion system F family protein [Ruaniaceae bacterium]|nr:type II secretion system F family protein [Ruaniaceae bacterium]